MGVLRLLAVLAAVGVVVGAVLVGAALR
jgi:hypothetical protein